MRAKAPSVLIIFYSHSSFLILLYSQKLLSDLQVATESEVGSCCHTVQPWDWSLSQQSLG